VNGKWVVRDVMSTPAFTATADAGFKKIVGELEAHGVSTLPVIEEDGQLIGIVSEADLLLKEEYAGEGSAPTFFQLPGHRRDHLKAAGLKAREMMSRPVITAGADTPLAEAARIMHERRVKRLVVTDSDGYVEGVVSRVDILKVFLRSDEVIQKEIQTLVRDLLWVEGDEVKVHVQNGIVRLEGRLPRRSDAELLGELLERHAGVVALDGEIEYLEDDTTPPSDPRQLWFSEALPIGGSKAPW
jgi:CBS domain-containing protein